MEPFVCGCEVNFRKGTRTYCSMHDPTRNDEAVLHVLNNSSTWQYRTDGTSFRKILGHDELLRHELYKLLKGK